MTRILSDTMRKTELPAFDLEEELGFLLSSREQGARVATVLHAARILEVLGVEAASHFRKKRPGTVFAGLLTLRQMGVLGGHPELLFHALRRMGNQVRHVHRTMGAEDVEVATNVTERVVSWYGHAFPYGPQVKPGQVWSDGGSGLIPGGSELDRAFRVLADPGSDLAPLAERCRTSDSSTMATLVAQEAWRRKRFNDLLGWVETWPQQVHGDLVVRQQRALALREAGQPEEALAELKALGERYEQTPPRAPFGARVGATPLSPVFRWSSATVPCSWSCCRRGPPRFQCLPRGASPRGSTRRRH